MKRGMIRARTRLSWTFDLSGRVRAFPITSTGTLSKTHWVEGTWKSLASGADGPVPETGQEGR